MILLSGRERAANGAVALDRHKQGYRHARREPKDLCWPTCKQAAATLSEPPRRSPLDFPSRWAFSPVSRTTTAGLGTRTDRTCSATFDPDRWERVAENPVKLLQEANAQRLIDAAGDEALLARAQRARGARPGRPQPSHPRRPRHRRPPDRVLLRGVRVARLVPDLQRRPRRARRRHPQGGLRPCVAADRDRAPVPQRLLPPADRQQRLAARVLGRHRPGPPARRAGHRRRRQADHGQVTVGDVEVVAQIWRTNVGRIPLYLLDADRPENSETARWITSPPLHRRRGHPPRPVPAARHRRRPRAGGDGDRAEHRAPQRGPRGVRLARARPPRVQRQRLADGGAGDRPQAHDLHHPHARPGRQRHLPRPAGRRGDQDDRGHGSGSTRRRSSASAGPTRTKRPSRSASRSSRCAPPAPPTASPGATARSPARCGTRCGPIAASTTSRSPT